MIVCNECGKQRRARDGKLIECDHEYRKGDRFDWEVFKQGCLERAREYVPDTSAS